MKERMRLFICLVVAIALLAVAMPRLPVYGSDIQSGFSMVWLAFCLLVIGANLHALLRLGRGEVISRPAMTKEQNQAIRNIQRYKQRRVPSR